VTGPFEALGQTIVPIPVLHGRLPISGYRIGNIAYITDAKTIPDDSMGLLAGLDILVLNGLRERAHPTHLSFGEANEIIQKLAPRHTYLVHLSHETSHEKAQSLLPPGSTIAWDGLTVDFADRE
jgi:phosphoribosyl 1,2-cyclic phosphate phosphodiesterase